MISAKIFISILVVFGIIIFVSGMVLILICTCISSGRAERKLAEVNKKCMNCPMKNGTKCNNKQEPSSCDFNERSN